MVIMIGLSGGEIGGENLCSTKSNHIRHCASTSNHLAKRQVLTSSLVSVIERSRLTGLQCVDLHGLICSTFTGRYLVLY